MCFFLEFIVKYKFHLIYFQKSVDKLNDSNMINGLSSRAASLMTIGDVCESLRTDTDSGLSTSEALRRQKFFGLNEFEVGEHESLIKKYIEQVRLKLISDIRQPR